MELSTVTVAENVMQHIHVWCFSKYTIMSVEKLEEIQKLEEVKTIPVVNTDTRSSHVQLNIKSSVLELGHNAPMEA